MFVNIVLHVKQQQQPQAIHCYREVGVAHTQLLHIRIPAYTRIYARVHVWKEDDVIY